MLVRGESTDRIEEEEFRTIEASLYQVLHRTAANEPRKMVQQTQGQRRFEARHSMV